VIGNRASYRKSAKRGECDDDVRATFIAKQKRVLRDLLVRDLAFETASPLDDFALGTKKEGRGGGNETTHAHESKERMSGFKLKHLTSIVWKALTLMLTQKKISFPQKRCLFYEGIFFRLCALLSALRRKFTV